MKTISRLTGLSLAMLALSAFTATGASAANLVDGSIGADDSSCSWVNGTTSADPPNTLTIENSSINGNLSCNGDISNATLNNDPQVTFDDAAGTATADQVAVSVTVFGVNCSYSASSVSLARSGDTRTYSGTATASKTGGSFLCPGSQAIDATVSFH